MILRTLKILAKDRQWDRFSNRIEKLTQGKDGEFSLHGTPMERCTTPYKNGRIIFEGDREGWNQLVEGNETDLMDGLLDKLPPFEDTESKVRISSYKGGIRLLVDVKFEKGKGALKLNGIIHPEKQAILVRNLQTEGGGRFGGIARKLIRNLEQIQNHFKRPLKRILFRAGSMDGVSAWMPGQNRFLNTKFKDPKEVQKFVNALSRKWEKYIRPKLEQANQVEAVKKIDGLFAREPEKMKNLIQKRKFAL